MNIEHLKNKLTNNAKDIKLNLAMVMTDDGNSSDLNQKQINFDDDFELDEGTFSNWIS